MFNNDWFVRPKEFAVPQLRLICFSYAGGNASTYVPWAEQLPDNVELVAVQLPGRANRMIEPPLTDMPSVMEAIQKVLPPLLDVPYVLFGHSLGSRVAFEVAKFCQFNELRLPNHLIASASRAPFLEETDEWIHDLPHGEFVQELSELNGTPKEVLENTELLDLLMPLLRADFKIAETYVAEKVSLDLPITVLTGSDDEDVTIEQAEAWKELSRHESQVKEIQGDHFFIESNRQAVLNVVNDTLKLYCARDCVAAL